MNNKPQSYLLWILITGILVIKPLVDSYNNYISEKNRRVYEIYLSKNEFIKPTHMTKKDLKTIPKKDRPNDAAKFEFLKTVDPTLKIVPKERLLDAYEVARMSREKGKGFALKRSALSTGWEERGPSNVGGRTRAIMFDPNDSENKKFWAGGVTGGLWYTDDITASAPVWQNVDDFWNNISISCIAYDPNDTQIFYVGTGENFGAARGLGVWKTKDGGQTWDHLSSTSDFYYINDIAVRNESGTSVLYVAVGMGYYRGQWHYSPLGLQRSTDGGSIFSQVMPYIPNASTVYEPFDIEIGPDNRIWIGSRRNSYWYGGGTVLYSDDGTSWTDNTISTDGRRVELAVAPSDQNTVYAMVQGSSQTEMYKTTDGGANWSQVTTPVNEDDDADPLKTQSGYNMILAVNPADADTVYVGGVNLFKSSDGGTNWNQIAHWYGGYGIPYVHADQHAIQFRPGSSTEMAFGNDGGIHYSEDGGTTFLNYTVGWNNYSEKNNGYNVTQFYTGAIHPAAGTNSFLGGTQDNGTQRFDSSGVNDTYEVTGGDGAACFYDEDQPEYAITSVYYNIYYRLYNGSYEMSLIDDSETGSFINPADYDSDQNILYAGRTSTSLTRIVDVTGSSPTRDDITTGLDWGSSVSNIKVSSFSSNTVFIGTSSGRLYKMTNSSSPSPTVTDMTHSGFPSGYLSCIELGLSDSHMLVVFSNYGVDSVWETRDGGSTWTDIEGNLPDMPIRWGIINPDYVNQVMLATEVGVWTSADVTADSVGWTATNDDLANVRVDMLRLRSSDGVILAATHGRGMFTASSFSSAMDVSPESPQVPTGYALYQNAPNPFNASTKIQYQIPDQARVRINVYDLLGRQVKKLVNEWKPPGTHEITWDGTNNLGRSAAGGVYIYRVQAGSFSQSRKMILAK